MELVNQKLKSIGYEVVLYEMLCKLFEKWINVKMLIKPNHR